MIPLTLSSDYSVWKLRSRVGGRELATVLWTPDISHLPIASAEISPPDPQKVYPRGFIMHLPLSVGELIPGPVILFCSLWTLTPPFPGSSSI